MKDIFRSKVTGIILWSLGGLLAVVLLLDNIILPWYVNHGGTLMVPDVVGMQEADAVRLLDSLKLEPRKGEMRPDKEYPEGYVVAQNPVAMQIVKPHRRIYLTISGGEQLAVVPDLKGRSLRDTKFALDRSGLKLGAVVRQISKEFPEGTIISQDIVSGAKIKRGSYIGVTESTGESMDSLVVPNVIGKTLDDAQKILVQKGFKTGNVTYQPNADLLPNTVIGQLPRGGDVVSFSKPIDLFIAQAPDKKKSHTGTLDMVLNKKQVLIAPSILAADFGDLANQIAAVEKAGADLIHLDVMDGHFVPNISFGPAIIKTVRGLTRLPLDTHLMIENPDSYLEEFQKTGTTSLTVHVEVCRHLRQTISAIRELGMKPGVSLKPTTPLSALEDILPEVDVVLVMSVNPGFGGQKFLPQSIQRIRELKKNISSRGLKVMIEVDGGVDKDNAGALVHAGADVLVAGTAIFGSRNISKAVIGLRKSGAGKGSSKLKH